MACHNTFIGRDPTLLNFMISAKLSALAIELDHAKTSFHKANEDYQFAIARGNLLEVKEAKRQLTYYRGLVGRLVKIKIKLQGA